MNLAAAGGGRSSLTSPCRLKMKKNDWMPFDMLLLVRRKFNPSESSEFFGAKF